MTLIFNTLVKDIYNVNKKTLDLINTTKTILKIPNFNFSNSQVICENINKELIKEILRIAIVGTIKSGKSTLTNSIFGKDYLRRGAGVLTSIVTRVRSSNRDQATLWLKNWEEINNDIRQSLLFIPFFNKSENASFDIRQKKDRENLKTILNNLGYDDIITNNARNKNHVLLLSYLQGYGEINKYIGKKKLIFNNDNFNLHRNFVSNDHLSIYLSDVLLEIKGEIFDRNVEIADCQGSDSLNPIHLSMIQDYLNTAHLIIYVISSRTGIREADIKFISIIKRMGILDNIIFVLNVDINEHKSTEDIKRIILHTKENLFFIHTSDCDIFAFSALYNLISNNGNSSETNEINILRFVNKEHEKFLYFLNEKINYERCFLLTNNHVHKLNIISKNLKNWIKINYDLLIDKKNISNNFIDEMSKSSSTLLDIKATIKGLSKGSAEKIEKEIFLNIDQFFGDKYLGIISNIIQFIRDWNFTYNHLSKNTGNQKVASLYKVFQEFRQALEKYIYEIINSEIIRFIHIQESKLIKNFKSLSVVYSSILSDFSKQYNSNSKKLNFRTNIEVFDINVNSNLINNKIKLPPLLFSRPKHFQRIKVEAFVYFIVKKMIKKLLRYININISKKQTLHQITVEKTIKYIKKDTEISILYYLKNYKENIKFQHIKCITRVISKDIEEQILSQMDITSTQLGKIDKLIQLQHVEKQEILNKLEIARKKSEDINNKIKQILLITNK